MEYKWQYPLNKKELWLACWYILIWWPITARPCQRLTVHWLGIVDEWIGKGYVQSYDKSSSRDLWEYHLPRKKLTGIWKRHQGVQWQFGPIKTVHMTLHKPAPSFPSGSEHYYNPRHSISVECIDNASPQAQPSVQFSARKFCNQPLVTPLVVRICRNGW